METILLVEDEDFVSDVTKRILERGGYTVLTAPDGKQALDVYLKKRDQISLVILDLIMPGMGGEECLVKLRKIDPNVRILVSSGYYREGVAKEVIESGARSFIHKPYDSQRMLAAVREVLDSD
jgi:two-component system cell cycle sensor histidine kinase/response regulator CckA